MSDVYPLPDPSMLVDAVDTLDRPIGIVRRREVLRSGKGFRVAHLFLFNARGELLIQQLAPTRDRHPLRWGSSVAAYLFAGESYRDAIVRRTVQELGRNVECIEFVGRTVMQDTDATKFISLFRATSDGPFTIDRDHIESIEFRAPREIVRQMNSGEQVYTPTFRLLLAFYMERTAAR